jgi:hypothetical protein
MALHQTIDAEKLALYREVYQERYPEDDPDTALNKGAIENKASKLFFLNEAGERCLWGPGMCLSGPLVFFFFKY